MALPNYLEKFINKAVVKLIFPDDADLNLTAFDMGEDMASLSIDEETTKRLKVAFGTVGAVEMAVESTINVSISKVTTSAKTWKDRAIKNGLINGANRTCVFYDDVGNEFRLFACTLSMGEISGNGQSPVYTFTVKGSLQVNEDLYGTLIG